MAAAAPLVRYLRRLAAAVDGRDGAPAVGRRHQQQLMDSGRVLALLGAITVTHQLSLNCRSAPGGGNVEYLVLGLILWLLGAALVTLSVAARRFPRLAAAGAGTAAALRHYLLGGL